MKKPKIKKIIPRQNRPQKLRVKYLLKRNGTKNKREAGTPTNILFAKIIVCVLFWCSMYENANEIILISGKAIIKPANCGFL